MRIDLLPGGGGVVIGGGTAGKKNTATMWAGNTFKRMQLLKFYRMPFFISYRALLFL